MSKNDEPGEDPSPWAVGPLGGGDAAEPAEASEDNVRVDPDVARFSAALPVNPQATRLPRVQVAPSEGAPFTWVAAHGGAGATSLARASGLGLDLTGLWPSPEFGWPARVVLVCRSNAAGIEAASHFLAEAASGQVPDITVSALVVSADAPGRPTRAARQRISELAGAVPKVFQLDWISSWRDQPYTPTRMATKVATALTLSETK